MDKQAGVIVKYQGSVKYNGSWGHVWGCLFAKIIEFVYRENLDRLDGRVS